jgi:predicted phosphodiesterase
LRVAVVSDIHANLHALETVLEAIDADPPDELWCLGDLVGYGPRPNEVADVIRERAQLCLVGNHDLGVLGRLDLEEFSPDAAAVVRWTRTVLLDENRPSRAPRTAGEGRSRRALPREPARPGLGVRDQRGDGPGRARDDRLAARARRHSHVALSVSLTNGDLSGATAPDGTEAPLDDARWLLNPGSVGQPRDGDPRAAWLELDFEARTGRFHRVSYDIARTQSELRERDLPEALAERLAHGV